MLQIKPIWSMMVITIALSIRTRSYHYWMRLSRISYDLPLKLYMTQYYALKISGAGSWNSNVYGRNIRYGGLPMWGFMEGDRNILQRFMNCAAQSWILILLQVKNIWSTMGIIIVLSIRKISYRYWMILSRRSYGCASETSYDKKLMLSRSLGQDPDTQT